MRVLVVDNHEDGMYKCRGELLAALTQRYEVFVSLPRGKYTASICALGCTFEEIALDRRGMNPIHELALLKTYAALLKRVQPDVVLTYSIKPNTYVGFLCAGRGIPYIANVTGLGTAIQDGGLVRLMTTTLYRLGLRKARKVFFQNEKNCRYMIEHGLTKAPYALLPGSGVSLTAHPFAPYPPIEQGEIRFLTIGRLMRDKGTDELLAAARRIKARYPRVTFTLIGFFDGAYEEKVRAAEQEGVVRFLGHMDDVHACIAQCHAVVHPSYHEGMANALLEAAAAGRPVIASAVAGCSETFVEGESGYACKAKDADSLYQALLRFIETPYEKKAAMGRAGRAWMEERFDRRIVVQAYLDEIAAI